MDDLREHTAFEALSRLLGGMDDAGWSAPGEPSIERLRIALTETPQRATALDLAVLLRQALRREFARREFEATSTVMVRHQRLRRFQAWASVGLEAVAEDEGWRVVARPWRPSWLGSPGPLGVDDGAAGEAVCRIFGAQDCDGDPFLAAIGRKRYRSQGQRAGVRAALSTPPGGTLVVALPTGEGKSMLFQLAASVGFVGDDVVAGSGVTLVIVPTVALGINHEEEAVGVCGLARPLAYQGGAEAQNALIAERIAAGSQELCFASPEAACGALRFALRAAAESGHLRAIVVDEAHLVDQWGTGFRTEFQELSGLRRELMRLAPPDRCPRTLLLSATLTASSLETLESLFGEGSDFAQISVVRLRPEPDYWIAEPDEGARSARILEAMHHVPRPAALYVTRVEHAEEWTRHLRAAGFGRLETLHGRTGREERERIVAAWRDGAVDVVVGTSAFGLGIDYPHARTVVHACVPETLDRYYQEVGRGGRDGRRSLALIVPAPSDFATAEGISRQKVITVDRGLERWTTMFDGKRMLDGSRISVRVDASPGVSEADIDMLGERNTDWNVRTLALMARAGLIRLEGSPRAGVNEPGDWFDLEILEDGHRQRTCWDARVEPVRRKGQSASARSLDLMRRFLRDCECPAEILADLYGREHVARVCSACSCCRRDPGARVTPTPLGEARSPWRIPASPLLMRLVDASGRLLVIYPEEDLPRSASRRLAEALGRMRRMGLAKLLLLGPSPFDLERVLQPVRGCAFFVSSVSALGLSRLPDGSELVIIGMRQTIGETALAPSDGRVRILLAPRRQRGPTGHPLREVFGGRVLDLEEFLGRVAE